MMGSSVRLALLCLFLVHAEGIPEPRSSLHQPRKWFLRLRRSKTKEKTFEPRKGTNDLSTATTTTTPLTPVPAPATEQTESAMISQDGELTDARSTTVATAALSSLLQSTDLAKFALTGAQFLVGWYLVRSIWKAATEVLEDLQQDQSGTSETPFLTSAAIQQALQDVRDSKWSESPAYAIAYKLNQAGLPLFNDRGKSVESILQVLNKSELQLLQASLYTPPSSDPRLLWNQIKGLVNVQEALLDRLSAMRYSAEHHPYASILGASSPGVLLYGPPGCGKSLLIQALSTTARMPCLMITPSTLLRKYVGETNILVRTLWKLAEKLSPCIILLDELDGLFRERRGDEHDVSRESKTEFLQWWDGISKHNQAILVVGATNRPFDVDSAVLRRMPQSHLCGLPMAPARLETFQSLLQKIPHEAMDLRGIVDSTQGYSPSDLVQIVQTAVQSGPLREARFQQHSRGYRALTALDLVNARQVVGPTPLSEDYRRALVEYTQRHNPQHVAQAQPQPPQHAQGGMQDGGEWGTFYHAGTFEADIEGPAIEEQASVESEWSEYDSHDDAENGSDADS
jgi:ATPase family AAA domain-containing protein 1